MMGGSSVRRTERHRPTGGEGSRRWPGHVPATSAQQAFVTLWPDNVDFTGVEASTDEGPVRVYKAQHGPDRQARISQGRPNAVCLPPRSVDQLRAVPAVDVQLLTLRPPRVAPYLEVGAGAVALRVDDGDSERSGHQVIQAGSRARETSVAQHLHRGRDKVIQATTEPLFPPRAGFQAFVLCRSGARASSNPPSITGRFWRTQRSRTATRRSYSRRAETPAPLRSYGFGGGESEGIRAPFGQYPEKPSVRGAQVPACCITLRAERRRGGSRPNCANRTLPGRALNVPRTSVRGGHSGSQFTLT